MQPISFDNQSYVLGGQRDFLISGEIHYFRVPRELWRDRLEKLKAAGGNCVATYVPWLLHEPVEGTFTFDGQLDVAAFLQLCNEVGLWAIVRPGPYQYSELAWNGLPGWLCESYPDLLARNIEGEIIGKGSVSYLHPLFLERARRWYDTVLPRLATHQTSRGGAVAAVQFDNELIGIHEWPSGGWDYNTQTMGLGQETGRWPGFLQAKYGSPAAAAHAYGRSAHTYAELRPGGERTAVVASRLAHDYQECYFESIAEYAQTLAGWMREAGVDVPLIHNSGNGGMNAYFQRMHRKLGAGFLLGSDHYYNLGLNWAQNNPTPQYALSCFTSLEQLRVLGGPPTVFELPGGSLCDFPPITAEDAGAAYLANLALGMKGWNYYIFAGGPSYGDSGVTTDIYDYGAAVAATGECRPLYATQQRLARFLKKNRWLAAAHRVADFRVGLDFEVFRGGKYTSAKGMHLSAGAAADFTRQGLLATAFCAGASPEFVSLEEGELPTDMPLAVVSWDAMPSGVQDRLARFLDAGGRLLLLGVLPTLDEDLRPCTILADVAGARQRKLRAIAPRLNVAGIDNVLANGSLFEIDARPEGAQCIAAQTRGQRNIIGFRRNVGGGGQVTLLGYTWMQAMREHEAMLRGLLTDMGWNGAASSGNPNVWTSLWRAGEQSMLFLLNLFTTPMEVRPVITQEAGQRLELGQLTIPAMSVRVWQGEGLVDPLAGE